MKLESRSEADLRRNVALLAAAVDGGYELMRQQWRLTRGPGVVLRPPSRHSDGPSGGAEIAEGDFRVRFRGWGAIGFGLPHSSAAW